MRLRILVLSIVIVLMTLVFTLDYSVGREFNMWLLYLVPIATGTFALGSGFGYALCAMATALLFLSGYLLGNPFESVAAYAFDRFCNASMYVFATYLIGAIRVAIGSTDLAGSTERPKSFSSE